MDSIDLMKQIREIGNQSGTGISLHTARNIVHYLIDTGLIEKDKKGLLNKGLGTREYNFG